MHKFGWLIVIGLTLLLTTGCGFVLTNSRAIALIEGQKETATFQLSNQEFQKVAQAGYWTWISGGDEKVNPFKLYTFQLTPAGMKIFIGDGKPRYGGDTSIKMREPLAHEVLTITKISDSGSGNGKIAEITWRWDFKTLPADLRGILKNPTKSVSVQFHYAGGWQITEIQ